MQDDVKIQRLSELILEETAHTEGDRSADWGLRAVGHIHRNLKRHNSFDQFFDALVRQDYSTKCCPAINEKLPGSAGRVNMFILRLYRFPWLRHEIQVTSIASCRYPCGKDENKPLICMNPFHYRVMKLHRVPVPPIVVNKMGEFGEPPERPENPLEDENNANPMVDENEDENEDEKNITDEQRVKEFKVPNVTMRGDEIKMLYERHAKFAKAYPNGYIPNLPSFPYIPTSPPVLDPIRNEFHDQMAHMTAMNARDPMNYPGPSMEEVYPQHAALVNQQNNPAPPHYGVPNYQFPANYSPPPSYRQREMAMQNFPEPPQPMEEQGSMSGSMVSLASTNIPNYPFFPTPPQQEGEEEHYYRSGLSSPASDIASPALFMPSTSADAPAVPIHRAMDEVMEHDLNREQVEIDAEAMETDEHNSRAMTPIEPVPLYRSSPSELSELVRKAVYECVEYEEKEKWVALMYYEESEQVGDIRDFDTHHCLVDGYSSTEADRKESSTRFSVGYYNNPKRSGQTSDVRSLIGKGVRLYLLAGEVYIENLSGVSVFVQSISANMKNGFALNTVSKLPPTSTMKVFDMRQFSKQLAAAAQKTYQDVYALSRMCSIRVSFVKGWGNNYRRSTVLRSPVWFQAHLYNPMAWIDSVLTCMGAPPRLCSSRT